MKYTDFLLLQLGDTVKYYDHTAKLIKLGYERALIAYGDTKMWAMFYELEKI